MNGGRGRAGRGFRRVGRGPWRMSRRRLIGLLAVALAVILTRLVTTSSPGPADDAQPFASTAAGPYTLSGSVASVTDGDTFVLFASGQHRRVRLASIDAPETRKNSKRPGQPMGQASRRALAQLIEGKDVRLSCFERDHYGRDICDVALPDGSTANRELVAMGLAWANMQGRGKYMRDAGIPELQAQARRRRLGIWRDPKPVSPWVWRYQCWRRGHC